jgi:hypothetical protein
VTIRTATGRSPVIPILRTDGTPLVAGDPSESALYYTQRVHSEIGSLQIQVDNLLQISAAGPGEAVCVLYGYPFEGADRVRVASFDLTNGAGNRILNGHIFNRFELYPIIQVTVENASPGAPAPAITPFLLN